MTKQYPLVSIIVVNFNGKNLLEKCFRSLELLKYPKQRFEILMVDNASTDGSVAFVRKNFKQIKTLKRTNNNYCAANNLGIKHAKGEFVVMLNNDVEVDCNWLKELVKVIGRNKKIAAVGSKILLPDGKIQSVGHTEFPYHYWGDQGLFEDDIGQYDKIKEVESISNCSALYRKSIFKEVGLFDEDFIMYVEDVDMAFRIKKKGSKIYYAPASLVYHRLHGSGQDDNERKFYIEKNRLLFVAKYFPQKLPDLIFGHGDIIRLKPFLFQRLLLELLDKLIVLYGSSEAKALFEKISVAVSKIHNYGEHCLSGEVENKISLFKKETATQQSALVEKDNQINKLVTDLSVSQNQLNNLTNELFSKDKNSATQQSALVEKDNQINKLVTDLSVSQNQLNNLTKELHLKEESSTNQQSVLTEKENQLRDLLAKLASQEAQSNNLTKELHLKNESSTTQQSALVEKDNQINKLVTDLSVSQNQLNNLTKELHLKEESSTVQHMVLAEKESKIEDLLIKIAILQEKLLNLLQELKSKNSEIESQKTMIVFKNDLLSTKDKQIHSCEEEIKKCEELLNKERGIVQSQVSQIQEKDKIIIQKTEELARIFNSEIFRYFVKPIVWPLLRFIKKIRFTLIQLAQIEITPNRKKTIINKKANKNILIAQTLAKSSIAKHGFDNEYLIKIFNRSITPRKFRLVIDIWPHENRKHPERHFSYFSTELSLDMLSDDTVKLTYDWNKKITFHFTKKNEPGKITDFWKGNLLSSELYDFQVLIFDKDNVIIDRVYIMQKLIL